MISCLATGSWSTQPSCTGKLQQIIMIVLVLLSGQYLKNHLQSVGCGPLSDPVNGQVTTSGTTFNSMATYSCDEGFNLVGSRAVTCGLDGVWTPSSPTCDGKLSEWVSIFIFYSCDRLQL